MTRLILCGIAALALGSCGAQDKQADALDNAASQSDPAAAAVLHNRADAMRDNHLEGDASAPGSPTQNALQAAGNAAATNGTTTR